MPPLKRPGVVDKARQPITDQEEFYSGCYGYVSINFYPFNAKGNVGVAAGLNNVMKVKDGESLGAGSQPMPILPKSIWPMPRSDGG